MWVSDGRSNARSEDGASEDGADARSEDGSNASSDARSGKINFQASISDVGWNG